MTTPREHQIIRMIANGNSTKMVADKLQISEKTVENHRTNIFRKMGFRCVADLVRYAVRGGIVALLTIAAQAGTIEWDSVEGAIRYRVFYSPTNAPESYTLITNTTATRVEINLPVGIWLVCYDAVAEEVTDGVTNTFASVKSGAIFVRQLPRPKPPRVTFALQSASSPEGPWLEETNFVAVATLAESRFYRGMMTFTRD